MTYFERFSLFLLYDGLTKEEYNSVIPFIVKENNRRLRIYNNIGLIFVLFVFLYSLFTSGFASKTIAYLGGVTCNLLIAVFLYSKLQNNLVLSGISNYFFTSLMLFFTMYVGSVRSGGLPATTFFTALALIPYILYNRVLFGFFHRLIFLLLFCYFSYKTKSAEYFRTDLINGISVFLISSFAGFRVQSLQVNGWAATYNLDKELKKMSGVFETIRIVDLVSNTSADYATDSESKNRIIDTNKNASNQMNTYIEEFVCDNNKAHMRQFCDLSTIEDRLYNKEILVCDFASNDTTWLRATFVSLERDTRGFSTKIVFTIQRIADSYYLEMLDFDLGKIK